MDFNTIQSCVINSCLGIAKTVECKHLTPDQETITFILRALYMLDQKNTFTDEDFLSCQSRLADIKSRLIPSCSLCGHPCGINDDPDINALRDGEEADVRMQLLDRCIHIGSSFGGSVNTEDPNANESLFLVSEQIITFLFESLYFVSSMQKADQLV